MVNAAREGQSQGKNRDDADVQIVRHAWGERQTEPSRSWFPPKFPSG